jgi:hypothetical protein
MSTAYELLLIVHSFTRWAVLAACVLTVARAGSGWASRAPWSAFDERAARALVAIIDLQVLLGLTLYLVLSPLARAARALWSMHGLGALWATRQLSFFGLIHPCLALLAAFVAHAAWVAARRADDARLRRLRLGAGAAVALALFLMAVPWPFLGHERPWFRFY